MPKRKKQKQASQTAAGKDEQVKDSNELLTLIRMQMVRRRNGPQEHRPKDLDIPKPE